jgi:hypothetical protein
MLVEAVREAGGAHRAGLGLFLERVYYEGDAARSADSALPSIFLQPVRRRPDPPGLADTPRPSFKPARAKTGTSRTRPTCTNASALNGDRDTELTHFSPMKRIHTPSLLLARGSDASGG